MTAPLIVLGVSRSGTTLLRVMLDRSSGLAVPDESFFLPLLTRRHGRRVDVGAFLEDLRRIATVRDWGLRPEDVAPRLRAGMDVAEALAAIFETYAERAGKPRWGDKTPMYMRHLPLIERLFPDAQYVHLIRDGRDAATSFLQMPAGTYTRTWAHPKTPAQFACLWRVEVEAARALGARVGPSRYLEARYEDLVSTPEATMRRICEFAGLPFEPAILEYEGTVAVSKKPHQQRLLQPLTARVRDWRSELREESVLAFEEIAGDVLAELGYGLLGTRAGSPTRAGRRALRRYRVRLAAWNAAVGAYQRSPLWRRAHPRLG